MVKLITWVANIFSNCFLTEFLEAGFKISFANHILTYSLQHWIMFKKDYNEENFKKLREEYSSCSI